MAEVQSQSPPSKPTKSQQPSVARHVAGRNSGPCHLLCGVFSSPYSSLSYFWGDHFLKHVALQVHVQTQKANGTWVSAQTGMSGPWLHIFTIKWPVIIFRTTCMTFFSFPFFFSKSESQLPYLCEWCTLYSSSSCDLWKVLKASKPHGFWFDCNTSDLVLVLGHSLLLLLHFFNHSQVGWAKALCKQRTLRQFYQ